MMLITIKKLNYYYLIVVNDEQFNYKLYRNSNTVTGNIIDFFHKKYKESSSSKSSSNSSNSFISAASDFGSMIKNNLGKLF